MDWQALMVMLNEAETAINDAGMGDHRPVAENLDGSYYCLGCEVGSLAQTLRFAIEDYVNARSEETA